MKKIKETDVIVLILISILCVLFIPLVSRQLTKTMSNKKLQKKIVVIDAGHGGRDPGKIAVNDALEKDINLMISKKLKKYLELNDILVVMTRESDIGLYKESDSNKKRADLNNRVKIIKNSGAYVAVSIHQNSFPQPQYKGSQVFYYSHSEQGAKLAKLIQNEIKCFVNTNNKRKEKANDAYFMLKQTNCPTVIVECSFLSNWEDAQLILTEDYQDKIAWAIFMGIMKYINAPLEEIMNDQNI